MVNNFNLNDNKETLADEVSFTTFRGNFSNNAMCVNCGGVPNTTPTPTTYTVTFTNSDNNDGSTTYTAKPFETIGNAIEEKKLEVKDYYPTYYYNERIVDVNSITPIKSDITINVKWTAVN